MINVTTDHIITSNLTKSSLMIHVVGITNRFITLRNKLVNNPGVSNSLCHTKASYNIRKKDGLIYKKFYTGLINCLNWEKGTQQFKDVYYVKAKVYSVIQEFYQKGQFCFNFSTKLWHFFLYRDFHADPPRNTKRMKNIYECHSKSQWTFFHVVKCLSGIWWNQAQYIIFIQT